VDDRIRSGCGDVEAGFGGYLRHDYNDADGLGFVNRRGQTFATANPLLMGLLVMTGYGSNESDWAQDLWGRTFLSTAVTEGDQDRPLVPGTRLRVTFEDGFVRADAGCNHLTGRAAWSARWIRCWL